MGALNQLNKALTGQNKAVSRSKCAVASSFLEWMPSKAGFSLKLSNTESMSIHKEGDKFKIEALIKGKKYAGIKVNIESAFKTLDQLLYKELHDLWFKVKCSLLLKEFQSELSEA